MQIKIGYFLGSQYLFLNYFYRQVLWVLACIHAGFDKVCPRNWGLFVVIRAPRRQNRHRLAADFVELVTADNRFVERNSDSELYYCWRYRAFAFLLPLFLCCSDPVRSDLATCACEYFPQYILCCLYANTGLPPLPID